MYRTAQQVKWDNKNVMDFLIEKACERGNEEGALAKEKEIALEMKKDGVNTDRIVKYTKLSKEQIEAL